MEEDSTSEGSQNPLLGFLFGNLDEGNRVDADYLDDDAREHLAGLAQVEGAFKELEAEVEEGDEGASRRAAPSEASVVGGGKASDAEDFADEEELIEEEAGPPALQQQQQQLGLVAAALYGGLAAEDEDYDRDEQDDDAPTAAAAAAAQPLQTAGPAVGSAALQQQQQESLVQGQRLAASKEELASPRSPSTPSDGSLPSGGVPSPAAAQLPSDPQLAAAAAHGLRLPTIGRASASRGASEAVLRFSELFGSSAPELAPPPLLPHGDRARQRAASQAGAAPQASAPSAADGDRQQAQRGLGDLVGDEGLLHAAEVDAAEYSTFLESEEDEEPGSQGGPAAREADGAPAAAAAGDPAGKLSQMQRLRSTALRSKSLEMPAVQPALRLPLAEVPESRFAGVQQEEWEEGIGWAGAEEAAGNAGPVASGSDADSDELEDDRVDSDAQPDGFASSDPPQQQPPGPPDPPNPLGAPTDYHTTTGWDGGGPAGWPGTALAHDGMAEEASLNRLRDAQQLPQLDQQEGQHDGQLQQLVAQVHGDANGTLALQEILVKASEGGGGFLGTPASGEAAAVLAVAGPSGLSASGEVGLGGEGLGDGSAVPGSEQQQQLWPGLETGHGQGLEQQNGLLEGWEGGGADVASEAQPRVRQGLTALSVPILEELGSTGRSSSLDEVGRIESPTMASILSTAPLLRLDRLQLVEAAVEQRGEEEDEGEEGGGETAPPSPHRLLLAVIPAADVAWEEQVVWEGPREAAERVGKEGLKLWLDLNDPGLTFEYTRKQGDSRVEHAAALILPHVARALPAVRAAGGEPQEEAALELARLNLSRDSAYLQQAKKRAGGVVAKVWHGKPATDLNTIPIHMTQYEMEHFHRPRGLWWPVVSTRISLKKKAISAEGATVTFSTLGGISRSFKAVNLATIRPRQLWDSLTPSTEFKEVADREPLLLLPGRPPRALPMDSTLVDAGVKPGETKVGITAAFTQVELMPTAAAEQIPAESNPSLLRAPHAFGRKKDLSAVEGGHIVLAEYLEAVPPLLNRPGMGAKLVTYYRKRDATDSAHQKLREGERWRVGAIHPLGEDDDSPFLGDLAPGTAQLAVEAGLFRAPACPYAPEISDFLLVRSPMGVMRLRELKGSVAVGQELPMLRVPTPNSRDLKEFEERRMFVYVFKELRRRQVRLDKRGAGEKANITVRELRQLFPNRPVNMIRLFLRDQCDLTQVRGGSEGEDAVFALKEGARVPTEAELKKKLTPDQACAVEASYVAEHRMKSKGVLMHDKFSNVAVEKLRLAARMLPSDEATQRAAKFVEQVMTTTPWSLTDAFVSYFLEQKANLQMSGAADPTGRGFGYSYIRDIRHKGTTDDAAKSLAKKQAGKVQGTDADLRRMTTEQAKQRLLEFGLEEEVINAMGRWQRIDAVREFATATVYDGTNMSTKYARAQKLTYIEQQKKYRARAQQIFDKQVAVLNNSAGDDLGEEQDELEDLLGAELEGAARDASATPQPRATKKGKKTTGPSLEDEERQLQEMRAAGFMGTPAKAQGLGAAAEAGTPGGAGAAVGDGVTKPGERRIRREVWMKQADNKFEKMQEIIYQGRDTAHMLASLYAQKEGSSGPWGFGMREIKGVPKNIPKLSYGAARGRGLGRGARGGMRGGAAAAGTGRGRAAAAAAPDHAGLPPRPAGQGRSRKRRFDEDDEALLEEEELEELPTETESEETPARARPRAKARRVSAGGAELAAAAAAPAAAATTSPQVVELTENSAPEVEEGDGGSQPEGAVPAPMAFGSPSVNTGIEGPADSVGTAAGAPSAGLASPRPVVKIKLKTAPSGVSAGARKAGRQREASPEFETFMEDLVVDDERPSDDDFRPDSDGGAAGGSDELEFEPGDDDLSIGEEDEEGLLTRTRSRALTSSKVGGQRRRSGTGGGTGGPRPKRKASVLSPADFDFPAEAVPVPGPAYAPVDKKPLNQLLGGIVRTLKGNNNFKLYFGRQVSQNIVPDYSKFVPQSKAMWLDRIQKKTGGAAYSSAADFRSDISRILECAELYNAPGAGAYGGPAIIDMAQQLVDTAEGHLMEAAAQLPQLEELAQGRSMPAADPYAAYAYGAPAGQAVPAAAAAPAADLWVQCTRCSKWRILSPVVYQETVANQPEDAPWFCENNFDRPNASCADMDDEERLKMEAPSAPAQP
ncbi:hypothetical protein N2152v2_001157 [Parachlorella kessleri]